MSALAKKKPKKQPPRRQQPDVPTQGDIGPDTPAQRRGAQIIELPVGGGKVQRKRRSHLLDRMHRRGDLTRRQVAAGIEYLNRWEATWRTPPPAWTRDHVDKSPRPGDVSVASLEAKGHFLELSQWVERDARWIVNAVVLQEAPIRPTLTDNYEKGERIKARLREQLNRLAAALRM